MLTSIIPPIPDSQLADYCRYHLLLNHLVSSDIYQKHAKLLIARGDFVTLDNSAHEYGKGDYPEVLTKNAFNIGVQEVVCPDELFSGEGTVSRTRAFLRHLEKLPSFDKRLMIVPQGLCWKEWRECLSQLLNLIDTAALYNILGITLGLSKDYEMFPGGLLRLLKDYLIPIKGERGVNWSIHLLGWGRDLWALREIRDKFGSEIRSIDSAKPIVYALAGIALDPSQPPPEYPKRPKEYFSMIVPPGPCYRLVIHNMKVFKELAGDPNVIPI